MALGQSHDMSALACMDQSDFNVDNVPVRSFGGSRLRFAFNLALAARRSTRIIYDFAGTARAHQILKLHNRPHAVWAHGFEVWDTPRPDYLKALARADLVLVNSAYNLERAAGALKGAKLVRVCQLATQQDDGPAPLGQRDAPPVVLLLGRIDKLLAKGHDILISIWPQVVSAVPDARLVLAGGGDAVDYVRGLASASPVAKSIDVTGFVPDPDIERMWASATIFAMPAFAEGFGLVYIEAMRRGIPVIASREDAGQEVNVDGVTGFNVSRKSPDQIAETIIGLLRDRDLCQRLGAQGHSRWHKHYRFSSFENRLLAATEDFLAS